MKLSATLELIWSLAGQEALAVRFPEIEPEHFLEALLKLSEMPLDALLGLVPDPSVARLLAREAVEIQQEVARLSIDSRKTRKEIRTALGSGSAPPPSDVLHRSSASREVFDAAARLASDIGTDVLTGPALLKAILARPTPVIARVLGNTVDPGTQPDGKIDLLVQHGRDLIREAREAPPPDSPCSPECNAFLQALTREKGKSLFLVTSIPEAADSLLAEATRRIASQEVNEPLWGKRIFDVRQERGGPGEDGGLLRQLFVEAAAASVLLVIPALVEDASRGGIVSRLSWLEESLERIPVQCVCQVSPAVYQGSIARDPSWKRIARVMWLHVPDRDEVLREL